MQNMAVLLSLMTKIRNLSPLSFDRVKHFPGTSGNPFDRVLHSLEIIDRIPSIVFAIILFTLSLLGTLPSIIQERLLPPMSGYLFLFLVSDWFLIALLPVTRRSFGPVKPVVLVLAILRTLFALLPHYWNLGFEFAGTLLIIYGFYFEPFQLDVHFEKFITNKIPNFPTLRIIHLGDLHIERMTRREELILNTVKTLSPDLILFSGDILNLSYLDDLQAQADARFFMNNLSAPMGVLGVSGSPAVDLPDRFACLVADTPMQWLNNAVTTIPFGDSFLSIYGLTCTHDPAKDDKVLQQIIQTHPLETGNLNILLHHSPDLAPHSSRYGFDLQLSGHTHGGQIRLPLIGALFTGSLYKKAFEAGRYLVNGMTLYVTRGLGMEGAIAPRVRLLCRPELVVWDFCQK
ncbi:MAG: metallophosphoesterase [Anaerolineaceae bacterium]